MVTPTIDTGYEIEEYTLKELLGVGAFGKVFKAIDKDKKEYAIKIINSEIRDQQPEWNYFLREISHLSELASDNIIHMYGKYPLKQDGYYFLILEYCNGSNLLDYVLGRGYQLSMQEIMEIAHDLAYALFVMHSADIAHRDLKLENIMVHDDPVSKHRIFKLIDLGLSRKMNSMAQTIAGTLGYLAPQIFLGKEHSKSADIWSYGILLFQLLYKEFPFGVKSYQSMVLKGICRIPKIKVASNNYMDLLIKCLKFKEKDRFTIEQVLMHPFFMQANNEKSIITKFNIME